MTGPDTVTGFYLLDLSLIHIYVAPSTRRHVFALSEELEKRGFTGTLYMMQSSGGVIRAEMASSTAVYTLMSGPVGGAIGASVINRDNLIGFDIGGTSFDVSIIVNNRMETTVEAEIEGFPVLAPTVNVFSIGAGGGSIAWNEAGGMRVGPVSYTHLARWLDCEYSESASREAYLERALKDQDITEDKEVIVYDYTGEQAPAVAGYLKEQGIENVSVFKANELIDAGTDLESYENYDRFIPTEIVKSISDVKTGKEETLSDEAKAVVGDDVSNVVLVDVSSVSYTHLELFQREGGTSIRGSQVRKRQTLWDWLGWVDHDQSIQSSGF